MVRAEGVSLIEILSFSVRDRGGVPKNQDAVAGGLLRMEHSKTACPPRGATTGDRKSAKAGWPRERDK